MPKPKSRKNAVMALSQQWGVLQPISDRVQVNSVRGRSIHHLFEEQVERTPDDIALVSDEQQLTYRQLDQKANQLGHYLVRSGVSVETAIGVFVERSIDLVVAILGILKSGGVYVPLDTAHPAERLSYIMKDTRMRLLLINSELRDHLPPHPLHLICLDEEGAAIAQQLSQAVDVDLGPENLAYLVYTSGSTGRPKGVMIPHRVYMRCDFWAREIFGLSSEDRFLLKSVRAPEELFFPLFLGAPLVIGPFDTERDTSLLVETILRNHITVINLTPSLLKAVLNEPDFESCHCLKHVFCAGETLPRDIQDRFSARLEANLYNFYGLTEAPYAAFWHCTRHNKRIDVPIGRPADAQIYLLNANLEPVSAGQIGELYVGGPGVARGYLNLPELNQQRFIPDSTLESARIYKTGDLAYYDAIDGIIISGRQDCQVKIRGFRVELGEVEAAIQSHSSVREGAVALRDDLVTEPQLTAYLVLQPDAAITVHTLRSFLKEKLPEYAIPSHFVVVSRLPLTSTGKLDRMALKEKTGLELPGGTAYAAPRNERERELIKIWQDVLGRDRIGINDHFFDLGGHSLSATQVTARIRATLGLELPLRELFEAPSVAQLARRLTDARQTQTSRFGRTSRTGPVELSFAQERLWFLDQMEPDGCAYHIPEAYLLSGPLDMTALERSLQAIVLRHEVLRTTLQVVDGRPVQTIAPINGLTISTVDICGLPESEQEAETQRQIAKNSAVIFNLAKGPLLQVRVVRLAPARYLLLLNMHHVVSDDWSLGVFYRELSLFYAGFSKGHPADVPALPIQYADYAICQRQWLEEEELERQLTYWRTQLGGAPTLELPTDFPRPPRQTYAGVRHSFRLSAELTARLKAFNREKNATPFMSLLAVFQVLLSRYTGQFDILVGTPIANRAHVELEKLIGFFVNTLVLRGDLSGDPGFREVVRRVRRSALDAYQHQDLPFEKLVEELNPERDLSRSPLFQVMFALQDVPIHRLHFPGIEVSRRALPINSTHFDLELYMSTEGEGWSGFLGYNTDLFAAATIERMVGHYQTLLEAMLAQPHRPISEVPMLTAAEQQQLLVEWNRTAVDYSRNKCIHELFEEQVKKAPDAVAVVFGDRHYTYAELNARANHLAHHLRNLGVGPEVLVGVCVDRSLEMVVALLGTMKAGGAYVPIDPSYPRARVAFILEDADVSVLVTQNRWLSILPSRQTKMVTLDDLPQSSEIGNARSGVKPENLAYVIYTSGSTGRPKGVAIEHRNAVALIDWADKTFTEEEMSGVLASTSICFDLSVFELFVPLSCGGKVILADNILQLPALSAAGQVTLINTVPSGIRELVRFGKLPSSVLTVNLAGEPLATQLVQEICAQESIQKVYDLYGPSEDTIYSTCALRKPEGIATIGRPISNKQAYILNEKRQPMPIGVPGELYLGGDGLARGYLNRAELTAEKFVANPFSPHRGARLYRTGDLCRYLPDGNIEFLGRMDDQVKVRGFRIELGEVEAMLMQHPSVKESVVAAREDQPGDKRLVAYVVPVDHHTEVAAAELKNFLKQKLPDYMVPATFVLLEKLPVTPNGKVDRKSLPPPGYDSLEARAVCIPRNAVERQLAEIWEDVLNIEALDVTDNFFDLGGHSLLAARLLGEVNKAFKIHLLLATIFRAPTVESLAAAISAHEGLRPHTPGLIVPRKKGTRMSIFWAPSVGSVERFVECYHLAKSLQEHCSFYGFDPAPELTDIGSLALHCIRLMRTEQPHGPYAVVGFCHGGHVAYEIAQKLEAEGEKVGLLAIIDCSARVFATTLRQKYYWLRDGLRGRPRIVFGRLRLAISRRLVKAIGHTAAEINGEGESAFAAHFRAAPRHKAKRFGGRLVLFYSNDSPESLKSPKLGWDALARVVEVHPIPCPHLSMMAEPAVDFVAEELKRYLYNSEFGSDQPSTKENGRQNGVASLAQ